MCFRPLPMFFSAFFVTLEIRQQKPGPVVGDSPDKRSMQGLWYSPKIWLDIVPRTSMLGC